MFNILDACFSKFWTLICRLIKKEKILKTQSPASDDHKHQKKESTPNCNGKLSLST